MEGGLDSALHCLLACGKNTLISLNYTAVTTNCITYPFEVLGLMVLGVLNVSLKAPHPFYFFCIIFFILFKRGPRPVMPEGMGGWL